MPHLHQAHSLYRCRRKQHGAALIVMLVIVIMGSIAFLVSSLSSSALQIARDKTTAAALAQAKDALIGYAISVQISFSNSSNQPRPGELPCPDTTNDGSSDTPCLNVIGRLPWKTLGLPDLRDGSGERLWYAVSTNFKNYSRTSCNLTATPPTGCLNSDTKGTISVFASDGTQLNDGGGSTGVVAVIIAPGDVLTRQGGSLQDRSSAGVNTASNYLDIATVGGITEDNANFIDGSSTNGFIQGKIKDSNGNIIVNDQLLVVAQNDIMQDVQKRVAGEVINCLTDYANNQTNNNRYPWAAPITDLTAIYNDNNGTYFGRLPDDLSDTHNDSWNGYNFQMVDHWGVACNTDNNNTPATWWINWKEMVFYGVARSFRPRSSSAPSFPSTCSTSGNCLNVNSSSYPARTVVIVAGKMLNNSPNQTQRYSNRTNAYYYLEGGNQNADQSGSYTFTQGALSTTFNDTVVFR